MFHVPSLCLLAPIVVSIDFIRLFPLGFYSISSVLSCHPDFANFTALTNDQESASIAKTAEGKEVVRKLFKEFNRLIVEILKDLTDYLQSVTEATPTQENIDKLEMAIKMLHLRANKTIHDSGMFFRNQRMLQ